MALKRYKPTSSARRHMTVSSFEEITAKKPQKSLLDSLNGRKNISSNDYYTFVDNKDEIMRVAGVINNADKKIAELKAEIIKLEYVRAAFCPCKVDFRRMNFREILLRKELTETALNTFL